MEEKWSKEIINLKKIAEQKNSMNKKEIDKTFSALPGGVWLKLVSDMQADTRTSP